jgi:4'-phosphopantetheinyl transferase
MDVADCQITCYVELRCAWSSVDDQCWKQFLEPVFSGVAILPDELNTPQSVEIVGLGPAQVDIWWVAPESLSEPKLLSRMLNVLSAEERVRQARFRFARHRQQFLVSHALVRVVLSHYSAIDPVAWVFSSNRYGRPEIDQPKTLPSLRFNLSHTDGLAVCAVAVECDVGVDAEWLARGTPGMELASRYFAAAELAHLQAVPSAAQQRTFFDFWTLKEAYIKARGMGLAIPLDRFSFQLARDKPIGIAVAAELADDADTWQFAQHQPTGEHLISVAVRRGSGSQHRITWQSAEALLATLARDGDAATGESAHCN